MERVIERVEVPVIRPGELAQLGGAALVTPIARDRGEILKPTADFLAAAPALQARQPFFV